MCLTQKEFLFYFKKNLMQKSIKCKRDIEKKLLKNEKIKTILFISGKNSFYKTKSKYFFLIKFLKIKKIFFF